MFGAIEAGGTKFVCAVGTGPDNLQSITVPTTTPPETLPPVLQFFESHGTKMLGGIGIGSFGPVDLNPASPHFGYITSTPKPGWQNFDLRGTVAKHTGVAVAFETDVNAAAIGEAKWGAGRGFSNIVYITVGTGIGGGALVGGKVVHGLVHPEMGHLRLPHDLSRDPFPGACPFHGDCLEGLAAGPALQARWKVPGYQLPENHEAWALEAHYLALALVNIAVTLSPERILLGGGVMQNQFLFPLIRREFAQLLNGYVQNESITERIDRYIVPPQLGGQAGILGALALAMEAAKEQA